ncbi:MAG: 23S rRNA (uracil(1939)-C(5))-methyltransferase RlmD [Candidatus Choladocola sp.]|nr:23S rRNA (uracil(1939)-C(5))-methyltransferase RlmD [Candidatus Choladocola sp.]
MKKDDIVTVTIEDLSSDGLGVGHFEGMALFVKDTVIGDVVEAKIMKMKKTYGYARLFRLLEPSPDRVEPPCPVSRQCGGCQIQAMSYEAQLRFKASKVKNNLMRIGKFENPPMEPILGMDEPFRYRNKAQFPVGTDRSGKLKAGFYAGRTHSIIECHDCLLGASVNREILELVLAHMEKYNIPSYDETTGRGLVRHVMIRVGFQTGQIMVCIVINGTSFPKSDRLVKQLSALKGMTSITLNINQEKTNVIMGRQLKLLWGQEYIEDLIGSVRFRISPLSFYQVNPKQTEKLYGKALEYAGLTGEETVWDLYCGIGTISLFLARNAKQVCGVEIVPEAIQDARQNAVLNDITNAQFFTGKAEEVLPEKYEREGIRADVIVVDPPRKGCEEAVLHTMIQMAPERIVYVSCDSATLARDLKILCENGYELKRVCPVDMFGNSVHVETVCKLVRK